VVVLPLCVGVSWLRMAASLLHKNLKAERLQQQQQLQFGPPALTLRVWHATCASAAGKKHCRCRFCLLSSVTGTVLRRPQVPLLLSTATVPVTGTVPTRNLAGPEPDEG
jgi:hypothetical protein